MSDIIQQLGLDSTVFVQAGIFILVFLVLSQVYFKPFLKLFDLRHKRLIEDRNAAESLIKDADAKFEEYRKKLAEERAEARQAYEALVNESKREESAILNQARAEAKKITQEAAENANQQREKIKKQLDADVEGLARSIADQLLTRKE